MFLQLLRLFTVLCLLTASLCWSVFAAEPVGLGVPGPVVPGPVAPGPVVPSAPGVTDFDWLDEPSLVNGERAVLADEGALTRLGGSGFVRGTVAGVAIGAAFDLSDAAGAYDLAYQNYLKKAESALCYEACQEAEEEASALYRELFPRPELEARLAEIVELGEVERLMRMGGYYDPVTGELLHRSGSADGIYLADGSFVPRSVVEQVVGAQGGAQAKGAEEPVDGKSGPDRSQELEIASAVEDPESRGKDRSHEPEQAGEEREPVTVVEEYASDSTFNLSGEDGSEVRRVIPFRGREREEGEDGLVSGENPPEDDEALTDGDEENVVTLPFIDSPVDETGLSGQSAAARQYKNPRTVAINDDLAQLEAEVEAACTQPGRDNRYRLEKLTDRGGAINNRIAMILRNPDTTLEEKEEAIALAERVDAAWGRISQRQRDLNRRGELVVRQREVVRELNSSAYAVALHVTDLQSVDSIALDDASVASDLTIENLRLKLELQEIEGRIGRSPDGSPLLLWGRFKPADEKADLERQLAEAQVLDERIKAEQLRKSREFNRLYAIYLEEPTPQNWANLRGVLPAEDLRDRVGIAEDPGTLGGATYIFGSELDKPSKRVDAWYRQGELRYRVGLNNQRMTREEWARVRQLDQELYQQWETTIPPRERPK